MKVNEYISFMKVDHFLTDVSSLVPDHINSALLFLFLYMAVAWINVSIVDKERTFFTQNIISQFGLSATIS